MVFLGCVLHAFMHLASAVYIPIRGDPVNFSDFGGISNHRANVTYTSAIALAMLIADTARARAATAGSFASMRDGRWRLTACSSRARVLSTTRNGLIVFALLSVLGFVLVAAEMRPGARAQRGSRFPRAVRSRSWDRWRDSSTSRAGRTFSPRRRWRGDTDRNTQWLKGEHNETDLPVTASGKPVEPSAYYRIAYMKEGLRLLAEHPWGTRVGRDAFRLAIQEKYGRGGMSHCA